MRRKCEKIAEQASNMQEEDELREMVYQSTYVNQMAKEKRGFIKDLTIAKELNQLYFTVMSPGDNGFHITIRPDKSCKWSTFKLQVMKLVARKCFKAYYFQFEQKGVTEETLGEGFHVHIACKLTQRSKGEVLRDVKSSFKNLLFTNQIKDGGIQVDTSKNVSQIVEKYLKNYESKDGHKIITKEWDDKWRTKMDIPREFKFNWDIDEPDEDPIDTIDED